MIAAPRALSVVIATFNRPAALVRLLDDLAVQTLAAGAFEVIVVDDGSDAAVDTRPDAARPYPLLVVRQQNAGPAAARHRAIGEASGDLIVIVDDDMRIAPGFLESHLRAHPAGSRRVVLGRVRVDGTAPLVDRFQALGIDRLMTEVREGRALLRGSHLYTGNVSFRRDDYVAAGGFDPAFRISEDAELGLRLERGGATFAFSEEAVAVSAPGPGDVGAWLRRSFEYGLTDARVAEKHPDLPHADPWRFLFLVRGISRPWLLASAHRPRAGSACAAGVMRIARLLDVMRVERLALAATTFAYGLQYFAGVGTRAGSARAARAALGRHLTGMAYEELGVFARFGKLAADIRADHAALEQADERYAAGAKRGAGIVGSAVQRIGFQMMIAYRWMRFLRGSGRTLLARIQSRLIRHIYGADLHWDADIEPGVVIVHGLGLIVSHAARVGAGSILFQNVTLGVSIHPRSRRVGAPTLERGVHIGPGATLLGPITIGARTKVMAGVVLTESVDAGCVVEAPAPIVRTRVAGAHQGSPVEAPANAIAAVPGRVRQELRP